MLIMKILFNVLVLLQIKMNDQNKRQCGVAKNLKRGRISATFFSSYYFHYWEIHVYRYTYTHIHIYLKAMEGCDVGISQWFPKWGAHPLEHSLGCPNH